MSALNAILQPSSIMIAADTLACQLEGSTHLYMSKIYPLPHLHGVLWDLRR